MCKQIHALGLLCPSACSVYPKYLSYLYFHNFIRTLCMRSAYEHDVLIMA